MSLLERAAGIEPASLAWKAKVLPLHNARLSKMVLFDTAKVVKQVCAMQLRAGPDSRRSLWRTPHVECDLHTQLHAP